MPRGHYTSATSPSEWAPFRPSLELSFRGHRQSVLCAEFQPTTVARSAVDGTILPPRVVSSGADGAVMLWDAKTTIRALRFVGHRGPVLACAYSPRAMMLASCGHDGYARLWIPDLRRTSTTYPPRGTVSEEKSNACSWKVHGGAARAVAFAQDGSDYIYTAGDDKCVKCWDMNYVAGAGAASGGNKFVGSFVATAAGTSGHTNWVRCVAAQSAATSASFFHYIASGGDDKCVLVWDTRTYRPAHSFHEPTASVRSVRFHPDGYCLASCDASGTINLFDLRQSSSSTSSLSSAHMSGGRRYGLIQRYEQAHDGVVHDISFAPSGGWLLSAGDDGMVKLWDIKEGHLYCNVQAHEGAVRTCRFSDDGQFFVTGGRDGVVMVWRSGLPDAAATKRGSTVDAASGMLTTVPSNPMEFSEGSIVRRASLDHSKNRHKEPRHADVNHGVKDQLEKGRQSSVCHQQQQQQQGVPCTPPHGLPPLGSPAPKKQQQREDENGIEETNDRDRSFNRSEERYSKITPHGTPSPPRRTEEETQETPIAERAQPFQGQQQHQTQHGIALHEAGNEQVAQREDKIRSTQVAATRMEVKRLDNVEQALTSLAEYMQERGALRDEEMGTLREEMHKREQRHRTEIEALKDMVKTLVEQQSVLLDRLTQPQSNVQASAAATSS